MHMELTEEAIENRKGHVNIYIILITFSPNVLITYS